ncbi:MAG: RtcB family protein [Candidatus Omnitrophota bacterium]
MSIELKQISELVWEIPRSGEMLVPGRIYADRGLIKHLVDDVSRGKEWNALVQIRNVACLPGIQKASLAMADIHPGYGFAIGAIGAFDTQDGVISVAGVGFDCNCGVRTLKTGLTRDDLKGKEENLANELFRTVPAGIGSEGRIKLSKNEINDVLVKGARFAVERGYGTPGDLIFTEEEGCVNGADPDTVSDEAKRRGSSQIGTLGSGNHYLEVQAVEEIFDEDSARVFGLFRGQVLISIHCGSRALGHQIGMDYLKTLESASRRYDIPVRERELVCAPFKSEEGRRYFKAVNCGINAAFANRQVIAHLTRKALRSALGVNEGTVTTLYDVGHNTAKTEKHKVDGVEKQLIVHRKGATRAFGPGRPEVPSAYRAVGQPVLVGGTMGTRSYILHGTQKGMDETFGTSIHGAGRISSRESAKKRWRGKDLVAQLKERGIIIKGHSLSGVAEEAPGAYKDVAQVVDVVHNAGIAERVAMTVPLISVKG